MRTGTNHVVAGDVAGDSCKCHQAEARASEASAALDGLNQKLLGERRGHAAEVAALQAIRTQYSRTIEPSCADNVPRVAVTRQ